MKTRQLGQSELSVIPICLGTMTFGEQVNEADAHQILARSLERGVNFMDTAEMYSVPTRAETFTLTETIIGNWLTKNPGMREQWVIATKVAGPSRGMPWVRNGSMKVTKADIIQACEDSLKRLHTDVIDLYQIHWPTRPAPVFGKVYFEPEGSDYATVTQEIHEQLEAMNELVKAGKVKAIGLSNETPFGVHEFVRIADQYDLPRIATVQNPYSLVSRTYENALDETMYYLGVSMLAYSPLAFGLLTGKYDESGLLGENAPSEARLTKYESMRRQRWARPEALDAARKYNQLARDHGLTPTQLALAFCYHKQQVASTIIGVTSLAQLDECIDAYSIQLSDEVLKQIDELRWQYRDPAQ